MSTDNAVDETRERFAAGRATSDVLHAHLWNITCVAVIEAMEANGLDIPPEYVEGDCEGSVDLRWRCGDRLLWVSTYYTSERVISAYLYGTAKSGEIEARWQTEIGAFDEDIRFSLISAHWAKAFAWLRDGQTE
jgi:hypothetical protein